MHFVHLGEPLPTVWARPHQLTYIQVPSWRSTTGTPSRPDYLALCYSERLGIRYVIVCLLPIQSPKCKPTVKSRKQIPDMSKRELET